MIFNSSESTMFDSLRTIVDFLFYSEEYQSDISRTYPSSGKFTPRQKVLYEAVLEAEEEIIKYLYHGAGHYIGLDTHDVGDRDVLQPGMVLTVEPGQYIKEEGIGIRIEDDVLITENGYEVLSKDIIKSVADIERAMGEIKHSKKRW